jgi:sugar-specific transcriptional regulator TrmB
VSDGEAVEALVDLGLSTYEARVFVALVRLGSGTAREVAEVADVPRSQVYPTVDDLERRGFVSVQQASPQLFHPVSLAEARAQLERRFESRRDVAFDRLASLERLSDRGERSEDVWSITGETAVIERVAGLAREAERFVVYGGPDLDDPDPDLLAAFRALCDRGVRVVVVAEHDAPVADVWATLDPAEVVRLPPESGGNEYARRVLVADYDRFLLSVRGADGAGETAVWSARTTFAAVFSQIVAGSLPGVEAAVGESP